MPDDKDNKVSIRFSNMEVICDLGEVRFSGWVEVTGFAGQWSKQRTPEAMNL